MGYSSRKVITSIAILLIGTAAVGISRKVINDRKFIRQLESRIMVEAPMLRQNRAHELALLCKKYNLSTRQLLPISSIADSASKFIQNFGLLVSIGEETVIDRLLRNRLLLLSSTDAGGIALSFDLILQRAEKEGVTGSRLDELKRQLLISQAICIVFKRLPKNEAAPITVFLESSLASAPEGYYP